jgi:hypothetical protein
MEGKEKDMSRDDLIKSRAVLDQAAEACKEFSPVLWSFYSSLKEEGFTSAEAIDLTAAFMIKTMLPKS